MAKDTAKVYIFTDDSASKDKGGEFLEEYLSALFEDKIFLMSEDGKYLFLTEDGSYLIQEYFE